ncbi:MAG: hypothetical protein M3Y53_12895 [Thermoproteota archaeon]|nr:hypothetical protein [Thermoproteota archaeon]
MPSAIDTQVKKQVIHQWLGGNSRDRIGADNGIGAGTVSNIINEWKKGINDSEYESIKELAVFSKKEGLHVSELASRFRLYNYIIKLGLNEDQIESFIVNCMNGANSLSPEKIINLTNQLFEITKSESIPPANVPVFTKQKLEEKNRLEEQIQEAGAHLQSKNVEIETISEYNQLKEHLSKHNLSLEDPTRLLSILQTIKQIGYEPRKIVDAFASMKSLRQKERQLKNNCKMHEKRVARYHHILPVLELFVSFGIGIDPLIGFNILVTETAETCNIPISAAAFRVIKEIEDYRKIIGLRKESSRLALQIYTMNEILGRKNNAVMALLNLQSRGVTEDQILNVYKFFEEYGRVTRGGFKQAQNAPYIFKQ